MCVYIYIYICIYVYEGCLDKYISITTWPPKQKFLPLPMLVWKVDQTKLKAFQGQDNGSPYEHLFISLKRYDHTDLTLTTASFFTSRAKDRCYYEHSSNAKA